MERFWLILAGVLAGFSFVSAMCASGLIIYRLWIGNPLSTLVIGELAAYVAVCGFATHRVSLMYLTANNRRTNLTPFSGAPVFSLDSQKRCRNSHHGG
jgi:hypothetical protein